MVAIDQRVRKVLTETLEADVTDVRTRDDAGRVSGAVIAARFSGLDQVDRQALVWDILRQHLTSAELSQVGLLMTLTPTEMAAVRGE